MGRQGHQNFPFGIQILTAADYFTLGNRTHAYLTIAGHVASFPPYRLPLIDHLAAVKLRHWDPALRTLASQALARLAPLAPAHMVEVVAPSLLAQVDAVDLNRCVRALVAGFVLVVGCLGVGRAILSRCRNRSRPLPFSFLTHHIR